MHSSEIRQRYLRFFEERGHLVYPSDSLVPDDPTLLFTSAGMVQFKPFFIGERIPPCKRITTSQKCFRTDDLDVVGTTPFHHTFFEMLGNFSFGDYFKKEAIVWAWEFLTDVLGLPPQDLWVSVYLEDDEAAEIWHKKVGIAKGRIVRLGAKTNYWPSGAPTEGPNGPCGPCSEIFVDFGAEAGCGRPDCGVDCDCGRFSEIWNLVFTQFNREEGGVMTPLPKKNIDTGMGLERATAVLQGTKTNFETDLFKPIIDKIALLSGIAYGAEEATDVAMRVIADHSRAIVFALADGVMPSNEGRGYVLRRVVRRAVLKGKVLGLERLFLEEMVPLVVEIMGEQYPEIGDREEHTKRTVRAEEEKFRRTLDLGLQRLEDSIERVVAEGAKEFPGMEAFVLYDRYGFPVELTREILAERGLRIDEEGFERAMESQRQRGRAASGMADVLFARSVGALAEIEKENPTTEFVGYTTLEAKAKVIGILKDGDLVDAASIGDKVEIVLDRTPFYAESGGQVADIGLISGKEGEAQIENVVKKGGLVIHSGQIKVGVLRTSDEVMAVVDEAHRISTMRNHSATHLLHKVLRMTLGDHVVQSGSLVGPERLRFDFTHPSALTKDALDRVERIVNDEILRDREVCISEATLEEAKKKGAMALFGEKYGSRVRVVGMGDFSIELCGGTHVSRTSQIGLFKILSEGSIGAGLRRIEAVTGAVALERLRESERLLYEAADVLKVSPTEVPEAVVRLLESLRSAEKRTAEVRRKSVESWADELVSKATELKGIRIVVERVDTAEVELLRSLADAIANRLKSAVVVLGCSVDTKVVFVGKVTSDLVERGFHAGDLVREAARVTGGGGGGRADFAQAGGRDISKLDEALGVVGELVARQATS